MQPVFNSLNFRSFTPIRLMFLGLCESHIEILTMGQKRNKEKFLILMKIGPGLRKLDTNLVF